MNYCHRCESHYEKPGTCNCFAQTQPVVPAPVYVPLPNPIRPWWEYVPTYPLYPQITFGSNNTNGITFWDSATRTQ